MKIAVIVDDLRGGGAQRVNAQLSCIFTSLGHDVVLLAKNKWNVSDYATSCVARECFSQQDATEDLMRSLYDRYKFELCVICGGVAGCNYEFLIRSLKSFPNVRVFCLLHHSFATWLFSTCCTEDHLAKPYLHLIDAVLCVSPIQALWWKNMGAAAIYMPNPISVSRIEPQGKREKRIVWTGRGQDPYKRLGLAIKIFNALISKDVLSASLQSEVRMSVVGEIDERTKKRVLADIPSNVADRIDFMGYRTDAIDMINRASVLLHTSLFESAVPQVVLEAQACGTPVVAYDLPILRSLGGVETASDVLSAAKILAKYLQNNSVGRTLDINGHSAKVADLWDRLIKSLRSSTELQDLIDKQYEEIATRRNYEDLTAELQRAHAYFIDHYIARVRGNRSLRVFLGGWYRRIKERLSR